MAGDKWTVTAYEVFPVTREYTAGSQNEAVEKMGHWVGMRADEGREFLSSFRAVKSDSN